jgi:hypothetical protein
LGVIFLVLSFYYRDKHKKSEKANDILAEAIVRQDDPELEDDVFRMAMVSGVEEPVLSAIQKSQRKDGL